VNVVDLLRAFGLVRGAASVIVLLDFALARDLWSRRLHVLKTRRPEEMITGPSEGRNFSPVVSELHYGSVVILSAGLQSSSFYFVI